MDINELLEKLRAADCALETWKAENGLSDADGAWSGVGLAIGAIEEYDSRERENNKFKLQVEKWKRYGVPMNGWFLEIENECGEFVPYELDIDSEIDMDDSDRDAFYDSDVWHMLADGGPCDWVSAGYSDTWYDRFGVPWNKYRTPHLEAHESGIWGGVIENENGAGNEGKMWRVTRVSFTGRPTVALSEFLANHPDTRFVIK